MEKTKREIRMENGKKLRLLKRKDVINLPSRNWNKDVEPFDSLLLVNSGRNHDSGWKHIVIIGCRNLVPVQQLAWPDDINWNMEEVHKLKGLSVQYCMRTDMTVYGLIHIWSSNCNFKVGPALSSTEIKLIPIV